MDDPRADASHRPADLVRSQAAGENTGRRGRRANALGIALEHHDLLAELGADDRREGVRGLLLTPKSSVAMMNN
jgi:hypothetical protein